MNNEHEEHGHLGHIVPVKIFIKAFIVLIILTILTVVAAKLPAMNFGGQVNLIIAMAIASVKALIVALIFMHLKFENPLTWGYAFFPIFLLLLLLAGVFIDNPFRSYPQIMEKSSQIHAPVTSTHPVAGHH